MIDLNAVIVKVEKLLEDNTSPSLTYAALECRLALEAICYDRLRISYDYISYDEIKKWQPKEVLKTLVAEVDDATIGHLILEIEKPDTIKSSGADQARIGSEIEYVTIGSQSELNVKLINSLWQALSSAALHVALPEAREDQINLYGDPILIRRKIEETLFELKKISKGNIIMNGIGPDISFDCISCGTKNKRRIRFLKHNKIINCANRDCEESYVYDANVENFYRNTEKIECMNCKAANNVPHRRVTGLKIGQSFSISCRECHVDILIKNVVVQYQAPEKVSCLKIL